MEMSENGRICPYTGTLNGGAPIQNGNGDCIVLYLNTCDDRVARFSPEQFTEKREGYFMYVITVQEGIA